MGCAARIIKNVWRAVERARAQGVPVIWMQHSGEELVCGSPQWQWVPELAPAQGEPLVHKRFNSAFEQTALEEELARLGATHIALPGAAANWCIRATAFGALERGYYLTLIKLGSFTATSFSEYRQGRGGKHPQVVGTTRSGTRNVMTVDGYQAMIEYDEQIDFFRGEILGVPAQDFFVREHADNFQMHLLVEDVEAWHRAAKEVAGRFNVKVGEPDDRPWAMRDFTRFDPSGVLWRIAQNLPGKATP